jgi:hypothetical protein
VTIYTPVTLMRVTCSLPLRPDAPGNCGQRALVAVRNAAGDYLYRCFEHRHIITEFGGPNLDTRVYGVVYVTRVPQAGKAD